MQVGKYRVATGTVMGYRYTSDSPAAAKPDDPNGGRYDPAWWLVRLANDAAREEGCEEELSREVQGTGYREEELNHEEVIAALACHERQLAVPVEESDAISDEGVDPSM